MDNQRKKRLESVLEEIERHKYSVEKLEELLLREYKLEGGNSVTHPYKSLGWNLEITKEKQLKEYKQCKNKKNLTNYYNWFINAFKQDLSDELRRLEMIDQI